MSQTKVVGDNLYLTSRYSRRTKCALSLNANLCYLLNVASKVFCDLFQVKKTRVAWEEEAAPGEGCLGDTTWRREGTRVTAIPIIQILRTQTVTQVTKCPTPV